MKTKRTFSELVEDARASFESSFFDVFRAEYLVIIIVAILYPKIFLKIYPKI